MQQTEKIMDCGEQPAVSTTMHDSQETFTIIQVRAANDGSSGSYEKWLDSGHI